MVCHELVCLTMLRCASHEAELIELQPVSRYKGWELHPQASMFTSSLPALVVFLLSPANRVYFITSRILSYSLTWLVDFDANGHRRVLQPVLFLYKCFRCALLFQVLSGIQKLRSLWCFIYKVQDVLYLISVKYCWILFTLIPFKNLTVRFWY